MAELETTQMSADKTPIDIARGILLQHRKDQQAIYDAVREITDEGLRSRVATVLFGDKLAGDLGLRTTLTHPKTDYGIPQYTASYDFDDK